MSAPVSGPQAISMPSSWTSGETVVAWDAVTGKPFYNAIVWQDDRTQDTTEKLKADGAEELTRARAACRLTIFSASQLRWFLDMWTKPAAFSNRAAFA